MFKRYAYAVLAVSAAVTFALGSCASGQQAKEPGNQPAASSAADFAGLAARGYDVDYDRLTTPKDAVEASELMVRGRVVDVIEGISFDGKSDQAGRANPYVTLVIEVDSALKGAVDPGTKVYTQLNKSSASDPAVLSKAGKGLAVVAVLDDISDWSPAPGVTVVRPVGIPATGPLYLAFPDGLWLQGATDQTMVGVHATPAELGEAWGSPQTLDQYWAALENAAR